MPRPSLAVVALLAACAAPPHAGPAAELAWVDVEPGVVSLEAGGERLLTLRTGPGEDEPTIHPLSLPGGPALTLDRPRDHVHHHGLWFAWKLLDGVNYWEHGPEGRPAGRTAWRAPVRGMDGAGRARLALDVTYGHHAAGDATDVPPRPRVTERRDLVVHPPGPDGAWAIDWTSTFRAVSAPVLLDRTPLPGEPGGRVFGGYAGLSLRLVQLEERAATTESGPVAFGDDDRARPTGRAFDYGGRLGGADGERSAPVGVAVLEHPENPRAPRDWYAIRSATMTFFTPALLAPGPLELRPDEPLRLAWRVIVHPGAWDAGRLAAELAAWDAGS